MPLLLTARDSAALLGLRPHEFYALYHSSQLPEPAICIWFPLWRREALEDWKNTAGYQQLWYNDITSSGTRKGHVNGLLSRQPRMDCLPRK